jgi:hypothetical protein
MRQVGRLLVVGSDRPARSNPVAKALASPLFRSRMVKSKKAYCRKAKPKLCCKNATLD